VDSASEYEAAVAAGQRALALSTRSQEVVVQVEARFYLAQVYEILGDYDRAIDVLQQSPALVDDRLLYERFGLHYFPAANCRAWLGICLADRGEFTAAAELAQEALRIAETMNQPFSLIVALWGVGYSALLQGALEQAIPALEPSLRLCEEWQLPLLLTTSAGYLGHAYALAGRGTEAIPLLEQVVDQVAASQNPAFASVALLWLAHAYFLAGRNVAASELASRALTLARERGERGRQANALWLCGEVLAHADLLEVEKAESSYREALALADDLGMRPLMAHCHLGLGSLYQKIGRNDEAAVELTSAAEMYRAMDMAFWVERAEVARPG
jgi:tetratricopeptide (TPR) repeat protein